MEVYEKRKQEEKNWNDDQLHQIKTVNVEGGRERE